MSKGLDINIEIGLCTKEMAKESPIKDFEILIEEHKNKWSEQMYDYFKECLNEIKKKEKALEIIKDEFQIDFNDKKQTIEFQSVEKPYSYIRFSLTREIKDKSKYDSLKEALK